MSGPRTPTGSGRGIALTIIANVGSLGIGLVTSVILARTLGPAGRGAYAAILTWPFVIGILGLLGVQQSAVYWTARQPGNARRIVTTGIALATVILAPVMLGAWLAMPFLLRAQGPSTVAAARAFVVVYGLASAGWLVTIGSMQGLRIFGAWNRVRVGQALLWMAMLSAAVALFPARPGPLSMLFAASYVVCIPWGLSTLSGASSGTWAPDFSLVRPLLRYGLASWSASVPTFLNRRLDQLAMAALVDPRILGLYAVAANIGIPRHVRHCLGGQRRLAARRHHGRSGGAPPVCPSLHPILGGGRAALRWRDDGGDAVAHSPGIRGELRSRHSPCPDPHTCVRHPGGRHGHRGHPARARSCPLRDLGRRHRAPRHRNRARLDATALPTRRSRRDPPRGLLGRALPRASRGLSPRGRIHP